MENRILVGSMNVNDSILIIGHYNDISLLLSLSCTSESSSLPVDRSLTDVAIKNIGCWLFAGGIAAYNPLGVLLA